MRKDGPIRMCRYEYVMAVYLWVTAKEKIQRLELMCNNGQLKNDGEIDRGIRKKVDSWKESNIGCRVLVENIMAKCHLEMKIWKHWSVWFPNVRKQYVCENTSVRCIKYKVSKKRWESHSKWIASSWGLTKISTQKFSC